MKYDQFQDFYLPSEYGKHYEQQSQIETHHKQSSFFDNQENQIDKQNDIGMRDQITNNIESNQQEDKKQDIKQSQNNDDFFSLENQKQQDDCEQELDFINQKQNHKHKDSDTKSQDDGCFPNLSYKERLIGFIICYLIGTQFYQIINSNLYSVTLYDIGTIIQLLSTGSFIIAIKGDPTKFAISFSFGNVISLLSTGFLSGFNKQLQEMKKPHIMVYSCIYLISIVITFISVILIQNKVLVSVFVIIQFISQICYVINKMPFIKKVISKCLKCIYN